MKSTANAETKEEFSGPFKPAKTLKQGSVLDLLKSPGKIPLDTQTVVLSWPITCNSPMW